MLQRQGGISCNREKTLSRSLLGIMTTHLHKMHSNRESDSFKLPCDTHQSTTINDDISDLNSKYSVAVHYLQLMKAQFGTRINGFLPLPSCHWLGFVQYLPLMRHSLGYTKNFYLYTFPVPEELSSSQQITELHLLAHSLRSCTQFLQGQRDFCKLFWQVMFQISNPTAVNS